METEKKLAIIQNMYAVSIAETVNIYEKLNGLSAMATSCRLSELCRKAGGANPCNGWCLNPMRAMILAIDNSIEFKVKSTLMDGDCCLVEMKF